MVAILRKVTDSAIFHRVVVALILINAMAMGLETWPSVKVSVGDQLGMLNTTVQALFVVEIVMRLAAHGRKPLAFFASGWNIFDFLVVALSLLPAAGSLATVARLARVLRAARLVSGMPELRLIIGTMLRSIPSMGHVVMLLGLLVYIYGVIGHHLFANVDPGHWGTLGRAAGTLFVVITLEGWVEILHASSAATPWAWVYYLSFIVIAVFVVINLFIAVVVNNLEKARREDADLAHLSIDELGLELRQLGEDIQELGAAVRSLAKKTEPENTKTRPTSDGGSESE